VARSIGARDVINELEQLFERHGRLAVLRSDNGREFIVASLGDWLAERGVRTAFIEKGSPQQNAFVERFNGTMRDEVLNGSSTACSKPRSSSATGWSSTTRCARTADLA
jgi:transposase InsO family protein